MPEKYRCQLGGAAAGPVGTVMAMLLEDGHDCALDLRASACHPPTLEILGRIGITPMPFARGLKASVYQWRNRGSGELIG